MWTWWTRTTPRRTCFTDKLPYPNDFQFQCDRASHTWYQPTLSGITELIQGLSHITSLILKTVIRNDDCITIVDYARVELATSAL